MLTKTSSGLASGGFVARQKPSESTLSIDVGGRIEIRHGPREHSAGRESRHPVCTYIATVMHVTNSDNVSVEEWNRTKDTTHKAAFEVLTRPRFHCFKAQEFV